MWPPWGLPCPNQHLLVQSQRWKHNNEWNLFIIKNEDIIDKTWNHWRRSCFFIVNFQQIWHFLLVFPWFTLNEQMSAEVWQGYSSMYLSNRFLRRSQILPICIVNIEELFSNNFDVSLYVKLRFVYTMVTSPAEWVTALHNTWDVADSNSSRRST